MAKAGCFKRSSPQMVICDEMMSHYAVFAL